MNINKQLAPDEQAFLEAIQDEETRRKIISVLKSAGLISGVLKDSKRC